MMENGEMDIDMDIDLGPIDPMESQQQQQPGVAAVPENDLVVATEERGNEFAFESASTPHKVHVRGVDDLTTADIQAFCAEHFPSAAPSRVEWINDTSVNLVFDTPATGMAALNSLSLQSDSVTPALQLRPAKSLSTRPSTILHVRVALSSDQKAARAHEASRFYMMHPEHDPRERKRRGDSRGNKDTNGDYRRRRYGDNENRRRKKRDKVEGFEASMYDDNGPTSRRSSLTTSSEGRTRSRVDSYRPRRDDPRDRSASPASSPKRRRRTPPPAYQTRDPFPIPADNKGKELFPTRADQSSKGTGKGLFSITTEDGTSTKKELFPLKANTISHRRSDAFDAADETADLFGTGMSVPFTDGAPGPGGLADRISLPNASRERIRGRALDMGPGANKANKNDISIRGAALLDHGISIRGGAASDQPAVGKLRELFPSKVNSNTGKELFTERLEGRGNRRNRAEDMFT